MQPPSGLFSRYVCQELSNISDVVRVQSGKSPEVMSKTAEVLRRHGFDEESNFLAGRQSPSFISRVCACLWQSLSTV